MRAVVAVVAFVLAAAAPGAASPLAAQEAADSVAHPIRTSCGVALDPVGFVLLRGEEVGLSADQTARLRELGERVATRNRPLGSRFWALAGNRAAEEARRAVLFELRASYRVALDEIRALLTPAQWDAAFRPPEREEGVGIIRCLARGIPATLGW